MEVTAAVLREVGGDFGLEKVRLDALRPGEVLVQISAVGICHTDLATRAGALPSRCRACSGTREPASSSRSARA